MLFRRDWLQENEHTGFVSMNKKSICCHLISNQWPQWPQNLTWAYKQAYSFRQFIWDILVQVWKAMIPNATTFNNLDTYFNYVYLTKQL